MNGGIDQLGLSFCIQARRKIAQNLVDGSQGCFAAERVLDACSFGIGISDCALLHRCHGGNGALLTGTADGCSTGFTIGPDLISLLLGSGKIGLCLGEIVRSLLKAGFGLLQLLKNRLTATIEDAAEETTQKPDKNAKCWRPSLRQRSQARP